MKDTRYISFSMTCRRLKKSRATVYRLMAQGLLAPYYRPKNPRAPIFLVSQVESLNLPGLREPDMNRKLHAKARARDKRCVVCFHDYLLIAHHVIPMEQGGNDTLGNLVTVCSMCQAALHHNGIGLEQKAKKHGTEAVVNWLLRNVGIPEINFS